MINKGLDAYEGVAQRTTELLANTNWPGSRAHVEGLRNALRDVIGIARHKEREAADAISDLTKRLERRDNAITYLLTLCDQFKDGLNWNDADRRVVASTQLTLTDLNMLNSARSVVERGLSREPAAESK